jgi:DNA-binding NarL/FixJ family response regulator
MAPAAAPIRVLIVDADVPSRAGVRLILSAADDMVVVGEASSGPEAVEQALAHQPDVVVMGILLPGMDGITATRHITSAGHLRAKVVILTTLDFDEYAHRAWRAGASSFLSKHATADALVDAVRAAARGATGAAARPDQRWVAARLTFTPPLTARERDVLYLVAEGLSNRDVAEQLFVSIDTIKSHLKNLYAKSGVHDRSRLVASALANGFARLGAPTSPSGSGGGDNERRGDPAQAAHDTPSAPPSLSPSG